MDKTLVNALMEMLASLCKNEGAMVTDTVQRVTGNEPHNFERGVVNTGKPFKIN